MRVHVLEREQLIPRPVEEVWPFFADAHNLEALTPPSLRFEIETSGGIEMREGALIAYRLHLRGIPVRWRTRIDAWEPDGASPYFVDRQLSGPYALWHHTHTFTPVVGGTLMRDRVRYRLPLGILGALALPLVRRELEGIFAFRHRVIAEHFGAPPRTSDAADGS